MQLNFVGTLLNQQLNQDQQNQQNLFGNKSPSQQNSLNQDQQQQDQQIQNQLIQDQQNQQALLNKNQSPIQSSSNQSPSQQGSSSGSSSGSGSAQSVPSTGRHLMSFLGNVNNDINNKVCSACQSSNWAVGATL